MAGHANITKEMTFSDVMEKYPQTVAVFFRYNLHCAGCPMSSGETIERGAASHGIDLKKLLNDLNKAAKSSK
jgi:hybrid cluster-associated redox disulfide protein